MKDDLINVVFISTTWADTFRQECKENPARFKKPIKRKKIKNLTTDAKKKNITQQDLKVKEVFCTRDIWERLVYLAAVHNLELEHAMSYTKTLVNLSLAHIHSAMIMNKTDKSALVRKLEKSQKSWTSRMIMCA